MHKTQYFEKKIEKKLKVNFRPLCNVCNWKGNQKRKIQMKPPTVPVVFYLQGHLWYPHKRNILTSLPSDSRMDPNCHLHRYLDVIYARLPYMYFRVCSYQIHIFRNPDGVLKWRRLKFQKGKNRCFLLQQSMEFLTPALQDLRLKPKIMKYGDLLYHKLVMKPYIG